MSILIKGMKMPQNCDDCHFGIDCPYDESQDGYKMMSGRPLKCPLVPVPPHGRLIDADELKTAFPCGESVRTECVRATIDHAPTIIPASFENPTKNARYSQDNPAEEGE